MGIVGPKFHAQIYNNKKNIPHILWPATDFVILTIFIFNFACMDRYSHFINFNANTKNTFKKRYMETN